MKLIDDIEGALNFNRNPARRETYDEATEIAKDLKKQVLSADSLEENYEYVNDFVQLFEDVVMMLVGIDGSEVENGHQTAISELEDFYRDEVWLMVAHSLSLETAKGPNRGDIYDWSSANRDNLKSSFADSLKTKKEICDSVGLLPDIDDYERFEQGEFDEAVDEFMQVVDGRVSRE